MGNNRRGLAILSLMLVVLFMTGFTPKEELIPSIEGIIYKSLNHDKLKIDLYMPEEEGRNEYPVVLFIHGGEWEIGSRDDLAKGDLQEVTESFLKEGFVVASVDYRRIGLRSGFSSGVIDTKDAIRWLKKNAENYKLDADNIGLWGIDRGGQIALLAAYTGDRAYQGLESLATYSSGVKYVLAYNPITDLVKRYQLDQLQELDNESFASRAKQVYTLMKLSIRNMEQRKEAIRAAIYHSPITYVAPDAPQTFLVCSTGGDASPEEQGKLLKDAFEDNGLTLQMSVLKTGTGRFWNLSVDQRGFLTDISTNYVKTGAFHSENYTYDLIIYPDPNRMEQIRSSLETEETPDEVPAETNENTGLWTQILQGVRKWFR